MSLVTFLERFTRCVLDNTLVRIVLESSIFRLCRSVAYAPISKYVAAIVGDAQELIGFAGMRRSLIYLQVCMLAAFGLAFAAMLGGS
jgi:hypothetical protein